MAKFAKKRTDTEIKNTKPAEKVNDIRCHRLDNRYEKQWLKTPNAKRYTPPSINNLLAYAGVMTLHVKMA